MPLINVHMAEGRSQEEKTALMTALTEAAVDELGAPRDTVRVWITEMPATDYMTGGELLSEKKARAAAKKAAAFDGEKNG